MPIGLEDPGLGFIDKIESGWQNFLSWIRVKHSVHPLNPIAPEYSEFVVINSKIKLRCIHIKPELLRKRKILEFQKNQVRVKRNSLSDDYWFTKSNKPLSKHEKCNCSFRKSLRLSLVSNEVVNGVVVNPPKKINSGSIDKKFSNVENFVECLIQRCLFEALQDFYMVEAQKNNTLGFVNLAFNTSCDVINSMNCVNDKDIKKQNTNLTQESASLKEPKNSNTDISNEASSYTADVNGCKHSKHKIKPIVILFHGIGTSSDIWWIVIKSLVSNGYEVVAPDMLGHGFSSAPDKESFYLFKNLLLHALTIFDNYVSSNKKCILIGHSYGCSFATAVYQHRMQHITQLVLISGGGPTPLAPPVEQNELIHSEIFQVLIQPLIFCGVNRSFFYSSRGKFFDVCDETVGIPNHILQFVKMGQNWPEGDATFHRRIYVPTLLVHGLQDKHVTLVQECEMERTIPRSFLELIPNAGHMAMIETPDHLTHMIICFLEYWS